MSLIYSKDKQADAPFGGVVRVGLGGATGSCAAWAYWSSRARAPTARRAAPRRARAARRARPRRRRRRALARRARVERRVGVGAGGVTSSATASSLANAASRAARRSVISSMASERTPSSRCVITMTSNGSDAAPERRCGLASSRSRNTLSWKTPRCVAARAVLASESVRYTRPSWRARAAGRDDLGLARPAERRAAAARPARGYAHRAPRARVRAASATPRDAWPVRRALLGRFAQGFDSPAPRIYFPISEL